MDEDYRATGSCRMALAKETFLSLLVTFALKKSNPYTERFNNAYMRLKQLFSRILKLNCICLG